MMISHFDQVLEMPRDVLRSPKDVDDINRSAGYVLCGRREYEAGLRQSSHGRENVRASRAAVRTATFLNTTLPSIFTTSG